MNRLTLEINLEGCHETGWKSARKSGRNHGLVHVEDKHLLLLLFAQLDRLEHNLLLVVFIVELVCVMYFSAELQEIKKL